MKHLFFLASLFFLFSCQSDAPAAGQPKPAVRPGAAIVKREVTNPYVPIDISPVDIAYFPTDFPVQQMDNQKAATPLARVVYSRPHRQGRQIFGSIVKWGEPWRLGANEATEIEFFQPATVGNKRIDKGRYILYAIPHQDRWTLVFNSNLYSWGLKFNEANDITRVDIPATTKEQMVEHFSMKFEKTGTGAELVMAWENREARLPIQF